MRGAEYVTVIAKHWTKQELQEFFVSFMRFVGFVCRAVGRVRECPALRQRPSA